MSRRQLFGSLCSLVFLVNFGRVVFSPLLEPLKATFGVTDAAVGLLATLVWFGSAIPRIPVGYLLTRVDRHTVVLLSGCVLSGSALFAATAGTIEVLMVAALCLGISSGAYFTAANPLITELFPDRVGDMIGVHGMASQFAAVVAPPVIALMLFVGSWRVTFLLLAGVGVVTTIVLVLATLRTELPRAGGDDRDFFGAAIHQWRLILVAVVIVGVTSFVWNGLFNFYVTYLVTTKAISQSAAQGLLTVLFGAGIPAFVITGYLAERLPNGPLMLGICGLFAGCLVVLTHTTGYVPLFVISFVMGYVIHGLFPTVDTFMLSALPDEHRASAYAVYSGGMMIAQAPGSSVIGSLLSSGVPFDTVLLGLAGVILVVMCGATGLYATGRFPGMGSPIGQ
ncbi:MFS transporter [Halocatena halophila]|uniref:MFS transporter n=1 Tax=Halocatena halophila TaxID=2814576 RepID=UPI002ED2BB8F